MTRTTTTLALVAALALGLAPGVAADHEPSCNPNESPVIPEDGYENSYPVYVVMDEFLSGDYLFSIWIYVESNGEPGLQRCDDACHDDSGSCDTVLF